MPGKIIHLEFWSRTVEGLPIALYRKNHTHLSRFASKRPFLFIGGVHGDEPEGVRLAQELLHWIANQTFEESKAHLAEAYEREDFWPWILIPCLNSEGYRHLQRTNSRGVDLNRNFPAKGWKQSVVKDRYYTGPAPASEVEVQSLIQLIRVDNPLAIFHFHSWEPSLIYTGEPGEKYAKILSQGNDYQVKADIGYPTPGSLGDWGWQEMQIPVICIEEQEHSDLEKVWPHFSEGLKKILRGEFS